MTPTIIILVVLVLLVLYLFSLYNGLVTARTRIREAWSGIEVQLKRRSALIPNLVKTVKAYVKHERSIYDRILKARQALVSAKSKAQQAKADNQISEALKTIFAIAESNPELKANKNFLELQEELSDTETKVAASRQFYNTNVLDYNVRIKVFPNVVFANMFGFGQEEFFKAGEEEKKDIEVDL